MKGDELADLNMDAKSVAAGEMFAGQPSHPAWPASMYMYTPTDASCWRA